MFTVVRQDEPNPNQCAQHSNHQSKELAATHNNNNNIMIIVHFNIITNFVACSRQRRHSFTQFLIPFASIKHTYTDDEHTASERTIMDKTIPK